MNIFYNLAPDLVDLRCLGIRVDVFHRFFTKWNSSSEFLCPWTETSKNWVKP